MMGERMHLIGAGDAPVYTCKKKDVQGLFSAYYWWVYSMWRYFHLKITPPEYDNWNEVAPDLLDLLVNMETHYRHNFSTDIVVLKYLESIIKHIRVMGGMK